MDNRFRITWSARKSGYRWVEEEEIKKQGIVALHEGPLVPGPYLVPVDDKTEPYNPLSIPTLFGVFADLAETQDEILLFANRYGLLRSGSRESLSTWRKEILLLRQAVWLWEKYRDNDEKALSDCIRWRNGRLTFAGLHQPVTLSEKFKRGDVIGPAKAFVSQLISQRLNTEVSAAFTDGVSFNLKTLVGAMWVQFAEAVSGKTEYMRCSVCKEWIKLKEKAKGKGKLYCSGRCRQRAQRQRK